MPKARISVMRVNRWRDENEPPPARAKFASDDLQSDAHANSRFGTGALSPDKPGSREFRIAADREGAPSKTEGAPISMGADFQNLKLAWS